MFSAVLDTCVLWPSLQRDFLLSLAVEGIYRPLWSDQILEELQYVEARKLLKFGVAEGEAETRAARLVTNIRGAFDDSCVSGLENFAQTYGLPDPNDEHVVAAAQIGGAGAIVTSNLKDFPIELMPANIDVQSPAVFALNTVEVNPSASVNAIRNIAARSGTRGAAMTTDEVLDTLSDRYSMGDAIRVIRDSWR